MNRDNINRGQVPTIPVTRVARDKICSLEVLVTILAKKQPIEQTIILAHGVFDLVHMGHVRHLESARRYGDVLVVSVTADAFVNKGPGRPVFIDHVRAEMLAALEYVDWVVINQAATAEPVIAALQPDIYAKGSDYANAADDVTGKIEKEYQAVQAYGGRVEFTDEITFSSSSLLNRHFDIYDAEVKTYLDELRDKGHFTNIMQLIEQTADMSVLIVGDTIIDEYQFVNPMGKSAKENLIGNLFRDREIYAGGVIAAANHAAGLCRQVDILTSLGEQDNYADLVHNALKPNIKLHNIARPEAPTTRKCRFIDFGYMRKLFEVYYMDDAPLSSVLAAQFKQKIIDMAGNYDLVIVTDFGHGLLDSSAIKALIKHSHFLAVNAQTNSGNTGFNLITRYPQADLICIDEPEARLAVSDKRADMSEIASKLLPHRIACNNIIVTQGRYGCMTWEKGRSANSVPALTSSVVDTVGAGDAFLAVTSPLLAAGGDIQHAAFVGNVAGAIKVGIVGHRQSVEKPALIKAITALLK